MSFAWNREKLNGQPAAGEVPPKTLSCIALRDLMLWQAGKYRSAVDENRWYMSQKQGRYISWNEAELDFCQHSTYGCAERWRLEYCGMRCCKRGSCLLATLFLQKDQPVAA